MSEIAIPHDAIVIVCGPSCSGKTTLAKRMFQETTQRSKYLYSVDQEILDAMQKIPELRPYYQKITHGGFYCDQELPKHAAQQLVRIRSTQLTMALTRYNLLIYDTIFLSRRELAEQMVSMSNFCQHRRPVVLVKILPDAELHRAFYQERRERRNTTCLPQDYLARSRSVFASQIMHYNFQHNWQLHNAFYEYAITDPRMIDLSTL